MPKANSADKVHPKRGSVVRSRYYGTAAESPTLVVENYVTDSRTRMLRYSTFVGLVGGRVFRVFERLVGYNTQKCRKRIGNDASVVYSRGFWDGRPAAVCTCAGHMHVFLLEKQPSRPASR